MIPHTPWPDAFAETYRREGYWWDLPLTDILARRCEQHPDAVALFCGERQFSYRDLDQLSNRLAVALYQRGVRRGQTALVQLPNVAEFYLVFFALLKLGVVPVNALYSHQHNEIRAYVSQLNPALIIGHARHRLFAGGDFMAELDGARVVLLDGGATGEGLSAMLAEGLDSLPVRQETPADKVAFFQLSGGSTGQPKLIPRTHNDYYYSVRRSAEICQLSPASRYLCALPAAHNFPLSSPGALGVFYAGGSVVLASSPEPGHCFALIRRHRVNMAALVPSAVALWLEAAKDNPAPLASLALLQVGGASFAESQARRVPRELGCQLQQVFGMAEGLVNYTHLDDDERRYRCQGRPMSPADEVKVVDGNGQPVAAGEVGLLLTRGPYTIRGYFQAPDHNRQAFDRHGFYCSGDLVRQDPEGYLTVVGRVKDQINRGGEKIAAEEIENLLLGHPDIRQAALLSIADERLGEKSCACLVSDRNSLTPVLIRKFLRQQGVADFKLPDQVRLLPSLPLTSVGKTDKVRLRQMLQVKAAEPNAAGLPLSSMPLIKE